jgi:hypothetical protein
MIYILSIFFYLYKLFKIYFKQLIKMESNNNLFKFEEPLCEILGIQSLVLKEDEIVPFLKKHQYITPYDESNDRYVVTRIKDAEQKMSTKLCDFFGLPHDSVLTKIEVTKNIFDYIKEHNLENPNQKNEIIPDEKLKELLDLKNDETLTYRTISYRISKLITLNGTSRVVEKVHEVVYNGN